MRGEARWRHSWLAPITLISLDDDPVTLRPLVVQACADPNAVSQLRALLHELGVGEAATTGLAVEMARASGYRHPAPPGSVHT
jgi:hypothetical protein